MTERRVAERRRGRPPVTPGEHVVSMTIGVRRAAYDHLARLAAAEGLELAPFVRRVVDAFLTEKLSTAAVSAHSQSIQVHG